MKANLKIINSMAKVNTHGAMAECMMEIGRIMRCMERGPSPGPMVNFTKENIKIIKKMEREIFFGRIIANTRDIGKRENNKERRVSLLINLGKSL